MGRTPCCDKNRVKRGAWSPEEDAALKDYLYKHGTGNWIALPHKAGLRRCGKSCRLRWLNYLRPDIKHGAFTQEEGDIIFNLYNRIGSRWSVIASHLQGRTDNDVKNFWNTKLKKKFMAPNNNTRTTTATSNAASTTASFDITTTLRKDSLAFPSTHPVPFLPHNCITTSLSANTTCTSCDQAINFRSPTFFLEWSSDIFSSPSHQESELLRSPFFGMGENYGVKSIPVNEDSSDVMSGIFSQVEDIGSGSNPDLFSIFQC